MKPRICVQFTRYIEQRAHIIHSFKHCRIHDIAWTNLEFPRTYFNKDNNYFFPVRRSLVTINLNFVKHKWLCSNKKLVPFRVFNKHFPGTNILLDQRHHHVYMTPKGMSWIVLQPSCNRIRSIEKVICPLMPTNTINGIIRTVNAIDAQYLVINYSIADFSVFCFSRRFTVKCFLQLCYTKN